MPAPCFATAADVETEKTIFGIIRAARPDDAVLGEEGGQQGVGDAVRQWVVDPLCGTLNYAAGSMLVAVNVALRDGAAAVADPFSGEVFFTRRGDRLGAAGRGRRRTADAHARYPIGGRQPGSAVPECARIPDRGRAGPPRVRRTFPTSCRIHVTGTGLGGCRQARRMCHRWRRPLQERALRGRHRAGLCRARSRHERGSGPAPTALGGESRPTARRGRGSRPRWCRAARLLRGQPARWVMPRIAS